MPKKLYPTDVLTRAISIQEAWSRIDEQLTFGNLSVGALVADITQIRSLEHSLSSLEIQLTELRNTRDAVCQSTWDKVKRVRAGVKANFGDDSSQYEMVGGTRLSDRKPMRRTLIQPNDLESA